MSDGRVVLGELELSQHVVAAGSAYVFAWDRCVELGPVLVALRAQGLLKVKSRAEGKTVRLSSQSPAKATSRWKRPLCESTRVKEKQRANQRRAERQRMPMMPGLDFQRAGDGYLISDMAAYLKLSPHRLRSIAKKIGILKRLEGTRYFKPFSREEAKHIIVYCRLESPKDRADYFMLQMGVGRSTVR